MNLLRETLSGAFSAMSSGAQDELAARAGDDLSVIARRTIGTRRDELRRVFDSSSAEAQARALERLVRREQPGAAVRITADSLTLMDDDQIANADAAARLTRKLQAPLEAPLRDVHMIAGLLAQREAVRTEDDPFASGVFTLALAEAVRAVGLEIAAWDACLAAYEKPLGSELARGYQQVLEHFRSRGFDANVVRRELASKSVATKAVAPMNPTTPVTQSGPKSRLGWMDQVPHVAGPSTRMGGGVLDAEGSTTVTGGWSTISGGSGSRTGTGAGRRGSGGPSTRSGGSGAAHFTLDAQAALQNLMARMQSDVRGIALPEGLEAPGAAPPDLLAAISDMQRSGSVQAPEVIVPVDPQSVPVWRANLIDKSTRTIDKLTIELVGMLFDQVLQDKQVPAEIKAVLSRLQFPVLKVALMDADFFASGHHPARQLIDRLGSTAVGWEPYGDENVSYKKEVERVVQQVLERFDNDTRVFEELLAEFDGFVSAMPQRETDPVARAKRALEEAEKREVLVINTTIQVRRAFEHVELEPYLREFLVGPWVQALVNATMRDEQTPGFSKAFRAVIHDMVWSVQPKVSADEKKRLVALIPPMTRVLRDGMNLVRMPEPDQQAFLQQLMASHAVAVRPVDQATYIKSSVATNELRQKLDEMKITGAYPQGELTGGLKISAGALQRAAINHSAQLMIAEPAVNAGPIDFAQDAELEARISAWQRGTWFNLSDGEHIYKVKLRWISPLKTLYMFSGSDEKSARVLAPDVIKGYLKTGMLRPIEDTPLTRRIVDRVVGEFERTPQRAQELTKRMGETTAAPPAA